MAIDTHLMSVARDSGDAILRCYAWSEPTVSFGRHERIVGRYAPDALREAGLGAVRRPTGGRALLHHREVTYAVALPLPDQVRWPDAYAAVNALLLEALHTLGVRARLVDRSESDPGLQHPDGPPCFAAPAPGEVAVGDAKLVGSAVWRERGAYLQHGSILLHDDQALLASAAAPTSPLISSAGAERVTMLPRAASLCSLLGDTITWLQVCTALESTVVSRVTTQVWELAHTDLTAIAVRRQFYDDPNWLWRR